MKVKELLSEETAPTKEGWFKAKQDFRGQLSSYDNRPPADDWIEAGSRVFATYTSQGTVEYSKTAKSSIIWSLDVKAFEKYTEPYTHAPRSKGKT